jgi:hypothetical protein
VNNKQVNSIGVRRPPAAGRGRKKGELNRTTVAVKEALLMAFEFYRLYAKLLPREINVDANTVVRRALLELADGEDG